MILYELLDLDESIVGRFNSEKECIDEFLKLHPAFDRESIQHWIYKIEIRYDICLPEYAGAISKKEWNIGRKQISVCAAINYAYNLYGQKYVCDAIFRRWVFDFEQYLKYEPLYKNKKVAQ